MRFLFIFIVWLTTRLLILGAAAAASGHPFARLGNWDGAWYGSIAMHGYGFAQIGAQRDLAFFPLFPMLARGLVGLGLGWPLAGIVVANGAFVIALLAIDALVRERADERAARWTIACTCACPLSLFASAAYPTSCILAAGALALLAAQRGRWLAAGLAAAAATATAALGIALAAALAVAAGIRRGPGVGIAVGALGMLGIGAFAAFCAWRFGDPLAFTSAQHAWRSGFGVDVAAWLNIVRALGDPSLLRENAFVLLLVPGGVLAILAQRRELGPLLTGYGIAALALVLCAGAPVSADRAAYGIVPVLVAYGLVLRRVPIVGACAIAACLAALVYDASLFARFAWVA